MVAHISARTTPTAHLSIPKGNVDDYILTAPSDRRAINRDAVDLLSVAGVPHCRSLGQPEEKTMSNVSMTFGHKPQAVHIKSAASVYKNIVFLKARQKY